MNAIVMMDYDYCIGINGDQVIHIRDDLKRFKHLTIGKTIVYGRKTLETFPNKQPLSKRNNIIISKSMNKYDALNYDANTIIVDNIEEIIMLPKYIRSNDIFIIGGESIYKALFPWIDHVYMTFLYGKMQNYYRTIHGEDARIDSIAMFPDFTTYNKPGKFGILSPDFTLINHEENIVKCKELEDKIRISYNEYVRF